jgi:hypothetical protein
METTGMERYVAVDNVCAWPNLTLLPDGSIAATIFNQPTHGGWEGDVVCWVSTDEGRLWQYRGTAAQHEPRTNRMNVAAGLARDGALVVLASGWSRRGPVGQPSDPHTGEILDTWVCRSADAGRTWVREGRLPLPAGGQASISPLGIIPFGDIVKLADGYLGVAVYGVSGQSDHGALLYVSRDDGHSWRFRSVIRATDANETALAVLRDGRLVAITRTVIGQHLDGFISDDNGSSWQLQGAVTLGNQHPGHLLALSDGRVLLTYGIRNEGLYGVGTTTSVDRGVTWQPPRVLVRLGGTTDGGYPATVQLAEGPLVTAYYSNGIPEHRRYHMGVVRWTLGGG